MSLGPAAQIFAFSVFAFIAAAGALGMTTTMSMFRSGIFLMASFIGVAGLFILLMADLLGMLQIMMYIGGMLVMILFMVLFSHDPGGGMMAKMEMPLIEKFFSLGLIPKKINGHDQQEEKKDSHHHHEHQQTLNAQNEHHEHKGKEDEENYGKEKNKDHEKHDHGEMQGMQMDMSMFTPIKKYAAWIGIATFVILTALLLLFPDWKIQNTIPDQDSSRRIGQLLMGKYMMAFEGAGLMILLGIFGAVYLARPGKHPDSKERGSPSAVNEEPLPAAEDPVEPFYKISLEELYQKAGDDK
jgi:NADH-quinone oxidoreductase subunit J